MEDTVEYTTTNRTGNTIVLSATFSSDEISAMRHEALQATAGKLRIPGFRPGKAPLSIVAQYVSAEDLKDDVVQKAASQSYRTFLKEHHDTDALIFEPEIVDTAWGDGESGTLKVDVRVFEMPKADQEFWKGIEIEDAPTDVSKAVAGRLNALVDAVTETSPKDGPVGHGDDVNVSVLTAKSSNPYHTEFTVGEGDVGKAYEDVLVGMKAGETKHFNVQLQESALEGDITVESVAEKHIPAVDDDFARSVGSFGSLAELRKALEDDEQHKADEARKDTLFDRAIQAAAQKLGLDFPMYVRRDATEQRLAEIKSSLARNGLSLNEYLKYNNITTEQLNGDVEADAVRMLQRDLLMEATERACGISADESEVASYTERHTDELAKAGIDIKTEKGHTAIQNVVVWDKTRDLVTSSVLVKQPSEVK